MAERQIKPARLAFRMTAAIGVGLGLAALWWEYSELIMTKVLSLAGLGG